MIRLVDTALLYGTLALPGREGGTNASTLAVFHVLRATQHLKFFSCFQQIWDVERHLTDIPYVNSTNTSAIPNTWAWCTIWAFCRRNLLFKSNIQIQSTHSLYYFVLKDFPDRQIVLLPKQFILQKHQFVFDKLGYKIAVQHVLVGAILRLTGSRAWRGHTIVAWFAKQ